MGHPKGIRKLCETQSAFRGSRDSFWRSLGRILTDPRHSYEEVRFVLLGISRNLRLLAVMYVERGSIIRIISARPATGRERREYEEIAE